MKKRVLVIADVPNWAWAKKAEQLQRHLGGADGEFVVDIAYTTQSAPVEGYDLYHTFEFPQVTSLPLHYKRTTGITAHVWRTWEEKHRRGTVREWASTAVAVHANSILLQREMEEHLQRKIYYVPNGVDEGFFRRSRPQPSENLIVGWVGKPNPRKGRALVEEACQKVGVEFRKVECNYTTARSSEAMREFYQDIHVLVVASDMDGTPNPALEAAACECAIVSNRIGNMPEFIVEGGNGFLVERSVESLANALHFFRQHPSHAISMGFAARKTIERDWTWKKLAENYATLWRDACSTK